MSLESNIAEAGGVERVVAETITGGVEVRVDPRGDSGVVREDVDELWTSGTEAGLLETNIAELGGV